MSRWLSRIERTVSIQVPALRTSISERRQGTITGHILGQRRSLSRLLTSRERATATPRALVFLFLCLSIIGTARGQSVSESDAAEFFENRIRPILVEHCYECHNSIERAESDLALDYRGPWATGIDGQSLLDVQNPLNSRLLQTIRHEIEGLEMPEGRPQLSPEVVADFEQWIRAGAFDPRETPPTKEAFESEGSWPAVRQRRGRDWCYQPIPVPTIPVPTIPAGAGTSAPLDAYIRGRLSEVGLSPASPAEPELLVRRLYLTLLGLPPDPAAAVTWTNKMDRTHPDYSPSAYEDLVDELLANPHFGERWARHWMDWIRYAESHGSEGDPSINNAHLYRDYLIRSLNADIPYDQLLLEHIAGDLLPEPRLSSDQRWIESSIATAHWRMVFHGFAPTDALDEQVRFTDDQINAVSKAFMGLTVSCARCHDHKFDAIGQDDYYAWYGVLNSNRAGRRVADYWPEQETELQALQETKKQVRRAIADDWLTKLDGLAERLRPSKNQRDNSAGGEADPVLDWLEKTAGMETSIGSDPATAPPQPTSSAYKPINPEYINLTDAKQGDASSLNWYLNGQLLSSPFSEPGEFTLFWEGERAVSQVLPRGFVSHGLSSKLPAILTSGDIFLDKEYDLWLQVTGDLQASVRYAVRDYPRDGTVYPVTRLNGGQWRWQKFDVSYWKGDTIHVELTHAMDAPLLVVNQPRSWFGLRAAWLVPKGQGSPAELSLFSSAADWLSHAVGGPAPGSDPYERLERAIQETIVAWKAGPISESQALLLDEAIRREWLPNQSASLPSARGLIAKYRTAEAEIPVVTRVPGLVEADVRDQPLFERGDHRRPTETVPRRFLALFGTEPYSANDSGRLQWAYDFLKPENPLPRRVIVNRLWHHLFGRGLVATPDNFGRLGAAPTHPELIDWMAYEFVETHDWSLKKMIRAIVMSETWRQDSRPSEAALREDPDNQWLSYFSPRRGEAEVIRDSLLAAGGRLELEMFGPAQGDPGHNRRAIYSAIRRNSLPPFLRTFDFPEPSSAVGRRDATTVPAQSLTLLNDPLVHRAAQDVANRVRPLIAESDEAAITELYRTCLSRAPELDEIQLSLQFLEATKNAIRERAARRAEVEIQLNSVQRQLADWWDPWHQKMTELNQQPRPTDSPERVTPLAAWEFGRGPQHSLSGLGSLSELGSLSGLGLQPVGNVAFGEDAVVLDGQSYLVSDPIPVTVREKTLEAWVQLANLQQRGGSVVSLQTKDGMVFDAIVFGEKDPGQWLAGSDVFSRTQSFNGELETQAIEEWVHLAITYHADGMIRAYRNGIPYGTEYKTSPVEFQAGQSVVTIGLRHLPAGGNKYLTGQVREVRLYAQALSQEEIAARFSDGHGLLTWADFLESLDDAQRTVVEELRDQETKLRVELRDLGDHEDGQSSEDVWVQLAHALMLTQEFISIR